MHAVPAARKQRAVTGDALFGAERQRTRQLAAEAAQAKLAAAQRQLERRQQAQLIAKRVESSVEYHSGLWQAQDRIVQLEEAAALLQAQQKQLRVQIAMQAGAVWQQTLKRLAAAWLPYNLKSNPSV